MPHASQARTPRAWLVLAIVVAGGLIASRGQSLTRDGDSPALIAGAVAEAPAGFVYVPGGWCWLGAPPEDAAPDEPPPRRAFVDGFYIGKTEVTNAEYQRFRPEHAYTAAEADLPVTRICLTDAEAYCTWMGGFLPNEDQWEKAARGADGRRYPWGDEWSYDRVNVRRDHRQRGTLMPVGAFPSGASPYGALDMAGNAWEWVAGNYDGDARRSVIRGGAHSYFPFHCRTYYRGIEGAGVTCGDVGFRPALARLAGGARRGGPPLAAAPL